MELSYKTFTFIHARVSLLICPVHLSFMQTSHCHIRAAREAFCILFFPLSAQIVFKTPVKCCKYLEKMKKSELLEIGYSGLLDQPSKATLVSRGAANEDGLRPVDRSSSGCLQVDVRDPSVVFPMTFLHYDRFFSLRHVNTQQITLSSVCV